ncbi:aminotransferase class I/II-fold pyridoxal phosphate-dependent enzyme [Marinobacterium lutimaris]|uniref:Aminotransferase n=1 Tax=Marinobacterium lutimaris TaxID=568106 RepID=A0A1H6D553_9GAMM|nr:aminotransferase class I/II-fold pyridoxal phosphate-dependent enzyme [Marinobacterium lutimaris]SEG80381.1 Aspartate/methionine/tyrosine aminotransferase [Marinobacterium lutimaris]
MSAKNWSSRARAIDSFKVMDLLKRARELDDQGFDVVHMEAGEPDFSAAPLVKAAASKLIDAGSIQYTPAGGIAPLRQRIAQFYAERYGVHIGPERVLVTPGASGGLLLAFALLAEKDSSFMMADPGYPCNPQFLRLVEARAQRVRVDASTNFQLTAELVREHWQPDTAGVLLASPANPTGSVVPPDEMAKIAAVVRELGGELIVDELYHGLTYGFDAETALALDSDVIVMNSFSKYFGMTGWRLGWLVGPADAVAEMEKVAQNLFISPPTISQHAALACFEPESIELFEQRRVEFGKRRDLLVSGLRELGFGIARPPEGAFYVYADASHLTDNSFDWCWSLLEEDKVAATPGADFSRFDAERYVRFSYTTGLDRIELALERLAKRGAR